MIISSSEDEEVTQVEIVVVEEEVDQEEQVNTASYYPHCSKSNKPAKRGNNKGREVVHFQCNYCTVVFQGPGSSTFLVHLRTKHPNKCPELLAKTKAKPIRGFFDKAKMRVAFNEEEIVEVDYQDRSTILHCR